jgi:hypothetical protein
VPVKFALNVFQAVSTVVVGATPLVNNCEKVVPEGVGVGVGVGIGGANSPTLRPMLPLLLVFDNLKLPEPMFKLIAITMHHYY